MTAVEWQYVNAAGGWYYRRNDCQGPKTMALAIGCDRPRAFQGLRRIVRNRRIADGIRRSDKGMMAFAIMPLSEGV